MFLDFGVGTALKHFEDTEQWDKVQDLYDNSSKHVNYQVVFSVNRVYEEGS
jgi:hypothetical protein